MSLPERNDDDTPWTRADDRRSTCGRNKVKTEDITRVSKRKELLSKEVTKQMLDDTVSQSPIRYQVYGVTLRLSPNKDDLLYQTFGSLSKFYPNVWVCCAHYDCIQVFDVTNFSDTQRNENLTKMYNHQCWESNRVMSKRPYTTCVFET